MPWYGYDSSQYRASMKSCAGGAKRFAPFVPQINGNTKKIITSVAPVPCDYDSDNDNYNNDNYYDDEKEGAKPSLDAVRNNNHYGYGGNKEEGRKPIRGAINHDYNDQDDSNDEDVWRNPIDSPVKKDPSPSPNPMVQPDRYGDYNSKEGPKPKPSGNPISTNNGYGKPSLGNKAANRGYKGGYKPREYEYDDNKAHQSRQYGPGPIWRRPKQPDDVKKGMKQVNETEIVRGAPLNEYWSSMPVINTYVHVSEITF